MNKNTSAIAASMMALGMKSGPSQPRRRLKHSLGHGRPQIRKPVMVKNPKIAAHINMMHEKWLAGRS